MVKLLDYMNKCGKYNVRGESLQIFQAFENLNFYFLKKLWCCVGGRDQNKNLVLSNELIKVELPP